MPNNIKTYDGTGDPEDHVKVFQAAAQVERWAMPTWTPKEILAAEANKFQLPPPMVTPVEKRNSNKFCEFHNDKGHTTDECMQIKKQIEELVRAGKLSHLIKEIKQGREQPKTGRKEAAAKDNLTTIYMVRSWQRTVKQKSQMVPATTSLTGFSGETTWPLGQLRLLVTIGDTTHSTKAWMKFMVVKSLSPYNGIIGRPGLKAIQAVPSTVHGMLKFLTEWGIVTICSSLLIPAECASIAKYKNKKVDALSKIASTSFPHLSKQVLVEVLETKSIAGKEVTAVIEEEGPTWMTELVDYLKKGILPEDEKEARKVRLKAHQYELMEGVFYKPSFLTPWLRCVGPLQAEYVMREIHEGSCSMHEGPRPLSGGAKEGQIPDSRHRLLHKVDRSKGGGYDYRRAGEKIRIGQYCMPLRVRGMAFKPGDFVYHSNDASYAAAGGKLGPKWEGPYEVTEALGNGAYKLRSTDGTVLPRTWNVTNLK
nr:reverse transcriptase domain-containing protein [Tanacetum cinerariifolium]